MPTNITFKFKIRPPLENQDCDLSHERRSNSIREGLNEIKDKAVYIALHFPNEESFNRAKPYVTSHEKPDCNLHAQRITVEPMELQCDCGQFRAKLKAFPKNTPGRLRCYCDDCQSYLHYLQRPELLDANGGTEIIPAYPSDVEILCGADKLKCIRIIDKGMHRFSTTCCNTPFGNTSPQSPWIGILRKMYVNKNPSALDQAFPEVRSSIMGRFAKGTPPPGTPKTFNFKAFVTVMPFMLKGKLFGKFKHSPVYQSDGTTPIAPLKVLTSEERQIALRGAGF